jgi:hypothetical protein
VTGSRIAHKPLKVLVQAPEIIKDPGLWLSSPIRSCPDPVTL